MEASSFYSQDGGGYEIHSPMSHESCIYIGKKEKKVKTGIGLF